MQSLTKALQTGLILDNTSREALAQMVFAYKHQPHSVTGETPANAIFGREVRGLFPVHPAKRPLSDDQIRKNDSEAKEKGKEYADHKRRAIESNIAPGDQVTVTNKRRPHKLTPANMRTRMKVIERNGKQLVIETQDGRILSRSVDDARKRPEKDIFQKEMEILIPLRSSTEKSGIISDKQPPETDIGTSHARTLRNRDKLTGPVKYKS